MGWISIKKRLPKIPGNEPFRCVTVLVADDQGNVCPLRYQRDIIRGEVVERWKYMHGGLYDWCPITHWMPLPEPPKKRADYDSIRKWKLSGFNETNPRRVD